MEGLKTSSKVGAIDAVTDGVATEASAHVAPIAMKIEDAAKISGVGRSSLFRAIKEGKLRARKAGARTLICYDDLRAFVDALPARKVGEAA